MGGGYEQIPKASCLALLTILRMGKLGVHSREAQGRSQAQFN